MTINIKRLRIRAALTQVELAKRLGYSERTVQRHENGEQTLLKRHERAYREALK